jgi:thiol:disulfide interchange protein DsbD
VALGLGIGAAHLSFHESIAIRTRKGMGVALATLGLFVLANAAYASGPTGLVWHKSLAKGQALAKEQKKPLLVDFWANWCGACKELDHTFADASVKPELERFVLVKIDATAPTDEIDELFKRHRVLALPVVVLFDAAGQEAQRVIEYVPPDKMLPLLKSVR